MRLARRLDPTIRDVTAAARAAAPFQAGSGAGWARAGVAALCVLAGSQLALPSAAAESQMSAPETFAFAGRELHLHGQGVRTIAWVQAYHCALYLPAGSAPPEDAASSPDAIAFRVRTLAQDDDSSLPDEWRAAMKAEVSDRLLNRMREIYRSLDKGDVIALGYIAGEGARVWRNGELIAHTDGPALMHAVVRMWLGDEPVSHSLRAALLDRRVEDDGPLSFGNGR